MKTPGRISFPVIALLSAGLILTLGPLSWMLITSFTPSEDLEKTPPQYGRFSVEHFSSLLGNGTILKWVANSLLTACAITFFQLLLNSLAAFGFSIGRFKHKEALFMFILAAMMVPGQILMLPLFLYIAKWNLLDSLWAVILPAMATPFGIYMIRQYMDSIPKDLVEAARIDGASEIRIFTGIFLPLSRPILATSGIFTFITHWNAFLWPLVVLNSDANYTLTVGLSTMQEQQLTDYGVLMAGATVSAIPMVIVFMFFSRHLLEGLRGGAIK